MYSIGRISQTPSKKPRDVSLSCSGRALEDYLALVVQESLDSAKEVSVEEKRVRECLQRPFLRVVNSPRDFLNGLLNRPLIGLSHPHDRLRFESISRSLVLRPLRLFNHLIEKGQRMIVNLALIGVVGRLRIPGAFVGSIKLGELVRWILTPKCHEEDRDRPKPRPDASKVTMVGHFANKGRDSICHRRVLV